MSTSLALEDATVLSKMPKQVGHASRDRDRLAHGVGRYSAQALFSPVLEDERYGLSQILSCFVLALPLAISTRDLRTVGDVPLTVSFDDRCELVSHLSILLLLHTTEHVSFSPPA